MPFDDSPALVLLRNDLRCDDNTALSRACGAHARVAVLFHATPGQWREHDMAPVKIDFIWRQLAPLRDALARLNIPLLVRVVPRFADVAADVAAVAAQRGCGAVYANREYAVNEQARDAAIGRALARRGIDWHLDHDTTLLPPGSVLTQQGQPFRVFTPFRRALLQWVQTSPLQCLPSPRARRVWFEAPPLPDCPGDLLDLPESVSVDAALWPAGEKAAARRLTRFINQRMEDYQRNRDLPALDGTSGLSPYLALGVISVRRCVEAALAMNGGQWSGGREGVASWINELLWREFYIHVLSAFPQLSRYRPMRPETDAVAWRYDEADFARWCEGRTGFPLVDAAMRQLVQSGWMHNRLRMVTAMFLCKYLLIDWRWGERFFMRHLIDGDLAANNGGWQWSASTGTDAVPYFRLLSPLRQAERFDAAGVFTKSQLPQLRPVAPKALLKPGDPALLATGYPPPMVDLKMARERVLAAFAAAQHHRDLPRA